ncbi:hypothetical protein BD410DRAFT_844176 [Rickenella mellea]|uniref:Uncharacterized protein n=1 Tax=Rickenella mellea TaxID=50990 RepID=A0A4Y7PMW3_9AGAM|nr:hypothetical protein BD410DRAFT_844176 [Rickenella mellea]
MWKMLGFPCSSEYFDVFISSPPFKVQRYQCNVSPPYSTHLCQRCEKAGLRECLPYNGRRRERRPAPYVRPTPPSDDPVYAHEKSNDSVSTNMESQIITENAKDTRNLWDIGRLVPYTATKAPSYSQSTPIVVGHRILRRESSHNDAELMANNTSTMIFDLYRSNSNAHAAQIKHRPATLQPVYASADASGSLQGNGIFGMP